MTKLEIKFGNETTSINGREYNCVHGIRNIFFWREDENFGYKILTKTRGVERLLKEGELENITLFTLNEKELNKICFIHNEMKKSKLAPKCYELVSFNNKFLAIKMERIIGEHPKKDPNKSKYENRKSYLAPELKRKINQILTDLGIKRVERVTMRRNYIICSKTKQTFLIDIDWQFIRDDIQRSIL